MKNKMILTAFLVLTSAFGSLSYAEYKETTCYKVVNLDDMAFHYTRFNMIEGEEVVDPSRSFIEKVEEMKVNLIVFKSEYETEKYMVIKAKALGGSEFSSGLIPKMYDGSYASDLGGRDIQFSLDQYGYPYLKLPNGVDVLYAEDLYKSEDQYDSNRQMSLMAKKNNLLVLLNAVCSQEDIRESHSL